MASPPPPPLPPALPSAASTPSPSAASSPPPSSSVLPDGILTLALPAPNAPRPTPNSAGGLIPPPSSSSTRRIPPPCWSHEETLALISSYKDKWDSLRRGVLRAPDWQDVAASVASLCSPQHPNPPKTPLQCRHKIEKLRKRYRAERQRAARANPSAPPRSAWLYFKKMDEIGLAVAPSPSPAPKPPLPPNSSSSAGDESPSSGSEEDAKGKIPAVGNGRLRLRIPVKAAAAAAPRYGNGYSEDARRRLGKRREDAEEEEEEEEEDGACVMRGLVAAVRRLADGYMRMEHMNIDMMREIEKMRMEMELKQTEMMLDMQRRIVDAIVRRIGGKKRAKVSPDC